MSIASGSALYIRLANDATLTGLGSTAVYFALSPQGAAYPFITIQTTGSTDTRVFGARATVQERWVVRAWDTGSSHKRAKQMAERADALLDEYDLVVSGGTAMACRRLGELPDLASETDGVMYRQAGATYEIEVRA